MRSSIRKQICEETIVRRGCDFGKKDMSVYQNLGHQMQNCYFEIL